MSVSIFNEAPIIAVNAIILREGEVLLTKRRDCGEWCLPGGLVEFGETVTQAVVREVIEEIGIKCIVERLVGVYSANNVAVHPPAKRNSIILAFQCRILQGTPSTSDEVSEVRFFNPMHRLPSVIEYQIERIHDALHYSESPVIR